MYVLLVETNIVYFINKIKNHPLIFNKTNTGKTLDYYYYDYDDDGCWWVLLLSKRAKEKMYINISAAPQQCLYGC